MAMQDYVLQSVYDAETGYSAAELAAKGTIKRRLDNLEESLRGGVHRMTNIIFDENRIIFDGHADTTEDCKFITALCDALSASEDFNTIKYESGYAEFEYAGNGESVMFKASANDIPLIEFAWNRGCIMFRGYSDDASEYNLIAAICDAMAASENFRVVEYMRGDALFEQVGGGESMIFAIKQCHCDLSIYAKLSDLAVYAKTSDLASYLKAADLPSYGYLTQDDLVKCLGDGSSIVMQTLVQELASEGFLTADDIKKYDFVSVEDLKAYVDEKINTPECRLPITASELATKLGKL